MTDNWLFLALASAFFASLTAILGKLGVADVPSNYATFIRTCVILLVSAALVWTRQEWIRPSALPGRTLSFLVLSGLATGASWLCYFRALQLGPASRVAPLDKLSVVLTIVLGAVLLREQLNARLILGGLLITAGSLLVAWS